MKEISFSNNELKELLNFYRYKYDETKERVDYIEGILEKLRATIAEQEETESYQEGIKENTETISENTEGAIYTENQESGYSDEQKAAESAINVEESYQVLDGDQKLEESGKKATTTSKKEDNTANEIRNLEWDEFLKTMLRQNQKLMSVKDFLNYSINKFNLPKDYKEVIIESLNKAISRLFENREVKKFRFEKTGYSFYGFYEWFYKNHRPKKEFYPDNILK